MKYLNFIAVLVFSALILSSCGKENLVSTVDKIPDVEPEIEIIDPSTTSIPSYSSIVENEQALLASFILDSVNPENNTYILMMSSSLIDGPGAVYISSWQPPAGETGIQDGAYSVGSSYTISQEGIDAYEDWEANGSDPTTEPDLSSADSPYITTYTATLSYEFSNINASTVDVTISGEIVGEDGNSTSISGTVTADQFN